MDNKKAAQLRHTEYAIDPIFLNRWSPRSFQEKEVPNDILMKVLEAARWAPSGSNFQPWRFIVARTPEDRKAFHSFIMPGNLKWSEKAPVLIAILSDKSSPSHSFDAGTSWGYLALQAASEGLIAHAMGGIHKDQARETLNIPDEYDLHVVVALGYQDEKEKLAEDLQAREVPSDRRPLAETLYEGKFE